MWLLIWFKRWIWWALTGRETISWSVHKGTTDTLRPYTCTRIPIRFTASGAGGRLTHTVFSPSFQDALLGEYWRNMGRDGRRPRPPRTSLVIALDKGFDTRSWLQRNLSLQAYAKRRNYELGKEMNSSYRRPIGTTLC